MSDKDATDQARDADNVDDVTVLYADLITALTWFAEVPDDWKNPDAANDLDAFNRLRSAALAAEQRWR